MTTAFEACLELSPARELLGPSAVVRAMLRLEEAMAQEQALLGLIPAAHAERIAQCCRADDFDAAALVFGSAESGSLAIPLVRELRRRVALLDPAAEPSTHAGATSQDLIDTAMALQGREVLKLLQQDLRQLLLALTSLYRRHGRAPLLARTLMQPALVSCLGVRLLNWTAPLARSAGALLELVDLALRLQLAGAVGDGAVWAGQARALAQGVARRLNLPSRVQPWQVQRDELARLAAELGVLVGALGKMATDVALMSQCEVGEFSERVEQGRGGSSAMPHKRNPVGAMVALSALQRAPQRVASVLAGMAHEQERALGPWQAELADLADLLIMAASAVRAMKQALDGAVVDEARMLANILRYAPGPAGASEEAARAAAAQAADAAGLDEAWAGLSASIGA